MRRTPHVALLAVLGLAAVGAAPAHALDAAGVARAVAPQARSLGGASGVQVTDLGSNATIYARNATARRVPASNQKLLTTAAALLRLGADTTLETHVDLAPGASLGDDGTVSGDLRLVGAGDPSLTTAGLGLLADRVRAAGVRRITGSVVGDGRLFDGRPGSSSTGYAADRYLAGSLGGLVFDHGLPGAAGPAQAAAARLQILLARRGVEAEVRARALPATAAAATARQVAAEPEAGTAPAPDAPAAGGADGTGDASPGTGAADGTRDEELGAATVLARYASPTVAQLAAGTNVPSDNFYAETLVKLLGARAGAAGTTRAGLDVIRTTLAPLGVSASSADGSGLSRGNRIAPREVVDLLRAVRASDVGAPFVASLAEPGRTGTLRRRMRGTPAAGRCPSKTGTLNGVSALSGYCLVNGRVVAFSIISNGVSTYRAKLVEDRIVASIARYTG